MVATLAPFGLRPARARDQSHGHARRQYPASAGGTAGAIHYGDPVRLSGGCVIPVGTSGDNTPAALGVFDGAAWVDPTTKTPVWSKKLPAGTSSDGLFDGYAQPVVWVIDDPDATFHVQADASLSVGDVGRNFNVTTSTPNTLIGVSRYRLNVASRTTSQNGMLRVVGLARMQENSWADPYPVVEVAFNAQNFIVTSVTP